MFFILTFYAFIILTESIVGLTDSNQSYYKCSGLVYNFLSEMTEYDMKCFLFTANELGFEFLQGIAIMCVEAMESNGQKSWDFLCNG